MKASQAKFSKNVGDLQAKAKAKKDKGTEASLARLLEKSNRIAAAQLTVDAFLLAILLLDQLQGEWDGYSYYVGEMLDEEEEVDEEDVDEGGDEEEDAEGDEEPPVADRG